MPARPPAKRKNSAACLKATPSSPSSRGSAISPREVRKNPCGVFRSIQAIRGPTPARSVSEPVPTPESVRRAVLPVAFRSPPKRRVQGCPWSHAPKDKTGRTGKLSRYGRSWSGAEGNRTPISALRTRHTPVIRRPRSARRSGSCHSARHANHVESSPERQPILGERASPGEDLDGHDRERSRRPSVSAQMSREGPTRLRTFGRSTDAPTAASPVTRQKNPTQRGEDAKVSQRNLRRSRYAEPGSTPPSLFADLCSLAPLRRNPLTRGREIRAADRRSQAAAPTAVAPDP